MSISRLSLGYETQYGNRLIKRAAGAIMGKTMDDSIEGTLQI